MDKVWEAHGLSEQEYESIRDFLGREPNQVELGLLGAMWSEHCSYKSSRIHLRKLPTEAEWVVQGPGENAGVVKIDDRVWVAFKVESHNHPSYIEPFNGSATGVGGIIRDVLSLGARPIALIDSLRFGDLRDRKTSYLLRGVVKGISSYGNSIGVPTVGGETFFEDSYATNPLVNAFCLGIMPAGRLIRARATSEGQLLVLIGSSTGRDGVHGAVMASFEFSEDAEDKRPQVQVGDPYFGKKLIEAVLRIVEDGLAVGIQDLGASGLGGAVSEICAKSGMGAVINLEKVPLREEGMTPYEILLSESQERMLLVVERDKLEEVLEIADRFNLEAGVVGETQSEKTLRVFYKGEEVLSLPVELIVDRAPVYDRPVKEPEYIGELSSYEPTPAITDFGSALISLLSSPNVASKSWIYTQYDYQVGTNTIVKPGSDSAVIRLKWVEVPELSSPKGVALSSEGNGRMVFLDPYEGAKYVVAEACRNVACSGARPLAITDCLNFGNPERPEVMWQFVKAVEGMAEACRELDVPVVSGNVSLYNETVEEEKARNIFPTPVVVCVGVIDDIERAVDHRFKAGNDIFLIGDLGSRSHLGGSEFLRVVSGKVVGRVPSVDLGREKNLIKLLRELVSEGLISSAHDISVGGLVVCVLESLFGTGLGAELDIYCEEDPLAFLFGEMPTRVVVGVHDSVADELKERVEAHSLEWMHIGSLSEEPDFVLRYNGEEIFREEVGRLQEVWERSLEEML